MAKVNDVYVLHSENGNTYEVQIINVNNFRPPEMKYACEIVDSDGHSYYETYNDYYFCGEDFISKCDYVER